MSDQIKKLENKELKELMAKVRSDPSEKNMLDLLKSAATAKFIVPVDGTEGDYRFHAVSDGQGRTHMVVFSDSESFDRASEGKKQNGILAGFEDLLEVVTSDKMTLEGFVVNPGTEEVLFGKDMCDMIWEQLKNADDSVKVGPPDHWPEKLEEMTSEFFKIDSEIDRIWIQLMRRMSDENLNWLIIIESALEGEREQYLLDSFRSYIVPYLDGIAPVAVSFREPFAKQVTDKTKPFYERDSK
ncbi:MAG: enhanced serine sensitivity protein SseB C-terminal domain-containing protein [Clostridiales bacterium]|nr:enhanced serine sensitivity protein SseB C-terminal domain-containing protein [Clostridiales bacterium]